VRRAACGARQSGRRREGRGGEGAREAAAGAVAATWQWRVAARAQHGARRLTGGAHSSAISEFKNH
jgi:hypothetical protein